jgi:hypothetical protein
MHQHIAILQRLANGGFMAVNLQNSPTDIGRVAPVTPSAPRRWRFQFRSSGRRSLRDLGCVKTPASV